MRARSVSIIGLMAAVYATVTLLPGFPVIGAPGTEIDLARSLEPIYGITIGLPFGPLAAFFGAVLGKILSGETAGILFAPLAMISTLASALICKNKVAKIPGWSLSGLILFVLIACWTVTPYGQNAPFFAIPHVVALGLVFFFRYKLAEFLKSNRIKLALGIFLVSYISTMTGNMLGNLIFVLVYNPSPYFFVPLLAITLPERLFISLVSTVIGAPLIIAVRKLTKTDSKI